MNNFGNQKVFIIGLDGATFYVLKPLSEHGYLPNITKLMNSGAVAKLGSVIPPITPSAWTSFMTGMHPGKHGIFDFRLFNRSTGKDTFVNSTSVRYKTIWQILSEFGKQVIVINLPMTYPPYKVNGGLIVSGFDSPSVESDFTYPSSLKKEILNLIPDYDFILSERFHNQREFEHFVAGIIKMFEQRGKLAAYLIDKYHWDVFMVHFQNVDNLQHAAWSYIDYNNPNEVSQSGRETVFNCYKRLDEIIGMLVEKVSKIEPLIILLSDHGFGEYYGMVYPNELLLEWGYLTIKNDVLTDRQASETGFNKLKSKIKNSNFLFIRKTYNLLSKIKSAFAEKTAQSWMDMTRDTTLENVLPLELEKTRAFVALAELYGFLYLNRNHKELQSGDIEKKCNDLIDELIYKFSCVVEPGSGENIFANVLRGDEVYEGSKNIVPDIILIPKEGYGVRRTLNNSGFISTIQGKQGTHRRTGIFIAAGRNIKPQQVQISYSIVDLAPTILATCGIPITEEMDGRILSEIFINPPKIQVGSKSDTRDSGIDKFVYTDEDAKKIENRLKTLGYLE